jgi:hypothetical protein
MFAAIKKASKIPAKNETIELQNRTLKIAKNGNFQMFEISKNRFDVLKE